MLSFINQFKWFYLIVAPVNMSVPGTHTIKKMEWDRQIIYICLFLAKLNPKSRKEADFDLTVTLTMNAHKLISWKFFSIVFLVYSRGVLD